MSDERRARALVAEAGAELAQGPLAMQSRGAVPERLLPLDEAEAERRAQLGASWLATAGTIRSADLPHDLALSLEVVRWTARRLAREHDWYWRVHDPMRMGFPGLFGPSAYAGGWHLTTCVGLIVHAAANGADDDHVVALVEDVAAIVRAMTDRLEGQRARGIRMPAPQVKQAARLVSSLTTQLAAPLLAVTDRGSGFEAAVRKVVDGPLARAFDGLADGIADGAADAPYTVGLSQYPRGAELYAELVHLHTTLDLGPEEVHAQGLDRMATIAADMAELRADVGFGGDDAAFFTACTADDRWREHDAEGVARRFETALAAARLHLPQWLHRWPQTPCTASPLPDALSAAMTYGYYHASPGPPEPARYLFNGRNLVQAALINVPALAFHELVPGHHVHLAGQNEADLPDVRKHAAFNAFNEGWAEYAATLAGEAGLYPTPQERFGRLMMEAFLTSRLIVDTGMNALGWSLERARRYMHDHAFMPAAEIESETIRYSCDMPGQALAYKLGDTFLLDERRRMRAALGPAFDVRDFHAAVLDPGALPLPLVSGNVDRAIAARRTT